MRFTLTQWQQSVICLGFQIHQLSMTNNLLTPSAAERGEFFFSDIGVPLPRPATQLAWSSLCAFGPINGYDSYDSTSHIPFRIDRGNFLLPFLPKIRFGEDTSQSLIRTAKAHIRDVNDRIRWGNIFIAEAANGHINEQLADGTRSAKEWADSIPPNHYFSPASFQHRIPPLYASVNDGWQFGIIQNLPGFHQSLRDPFIELARHGIPELNYAGKRVPRVRRLLIRFLELPAAKAWAKAYSEASASLVESPNSALVDAGLLGEEIRKAREQRVREAQKKSEKASPRQVLTESMLSELGDIESLLKDI